jgi:hypothetical protein
MENIHVTAVDFPLVIGDISRTGRKELTDEFL